MSIFGGIDKGSFNRSLVVLAALAVSATGDATDCAHAQSGTRNSARRDVDLALGGNCPVCLVEMKKEMPGKPEWTAVYQGLRYQFPSEKQRKMFLADPLKYVPALGGDCTVCFAKMGKRVPGNIDYFAIHGDRLFLFAGEAQKKEFLAKPVKYVPALGGDCTVCFAKMGKRVPGNIDYFAIHGDRLFLFAGEAQKKEFLAKPTAYADVDLALGGKCPVCLVEMKKEMPGKPEWTAIYQGLRYQFPSEKQRKMFLADPAKYVVKPTGDKE